ncbi:MAG: ABC transporter ATP-binding protein [Anaerolineae bacterium]|nr:ABC transporter ATP-binding protein [Anaerolineae bacterium]
MLELRGITRAFDEQPVLRGIDIQVERGEILCLLGPSGCGKTTLLRIIAGLEQPDQGDVVYDGTSIRAVPVHQRDFGLMFQDFALFPHMNVAQNVGFGLKMQRLTRNEARVREVIGLVGLSGFERRDVGQLSGGEKQRVALARSLAPNPRLLMLDEPLGSLDAALRARLVVELRHIIKQVGLTAMYVTHDHQEAFAIADRVAIMNAGQIEQVGTPETVYQRPQTTFCAAFLGLNNVVPVEAYREGQAQTPLGSFPVESRPDALLLHPLGLERADGDSNGIPVTIVECVFQGDAYRLTLAHESGLALTMRLRANHKVPHEGDTLLIHIDPEWVIPLRESRTDV